MSSVGEERSGHPSTERVSVPQAADHLGTTVDAIRKRVQRDTIDHEKDADGRVWVLLDTGRPRQDATGQRQDTGQPQSDATALISAKDETIAMLREQLEAERQAHAEARRLLMAALERIPPQLEAPQEAPEDAETVEEAREDLAAERTRRETAESTLHEGMDEERRRREEAERERDELRIFGRRGARGSPPEAEEEQGRGEPHSDAPDTQEAVQRPWWRRMFGR
jgi:hypothetical protein